MRRFETTATLFSLLSLLLAAAATAQKEPAQETGLRTGMTWTVLEQGKGYVHVGADAATDPTAGDTPVDRFLSVLCVRPGRLEAPPEIPIGPDAGWLRGEVRATPEVPGVVLTSRGRGDFLCADTFGEGWRLAELRDGQYSETPEAGSDLSLASAGSFWGAGSLPAGARFWVAAEGRRANPWDSAGKLPETLRTPKFIDSEAPVPGQYLAMFPEDTAQAEVEPRARRLAALYGLKVYYVYRFVGGFAFGGTEAQARALSEDAEVESVEEDTYGNAAQAWQGWHLDRVDERNLPLPNFLYTPPNDGAGVNIYVLDSGFRMSHTEFGGRATQEEDVMSVFGSHDDCNGHGTHVASLAGGATMGVASGANLISVRISGCKGNAYNPLVSVFSSTIVGGLDYVGLAARRPAVANVSYGFAPGFWRRWLNTRTPMDRAVQRVVRSGVAVVVAAGNEGKDADKSSPARAPEAISVSATDVTDTKPDWANYGKVDLFAPGVRVWGAGIDSDTALEERSGTSMAAPVVAGAAALYLHDNPGANPDQVRNAVVGTATPGVVQSPGPGSANLLVFVGRSMDVGVIPDAGAPCPGETIEIGMDDEDHNNANGRSGWRGRIQSNDNTTYTFCRVDGAAFRPAAAQPYAVLKLGATCPAGSSEFQRRFDNEDHQNANSSSGTIFPNLIDNNSLLVYCVFAPAPSVPAFAFPNLGFAYGVIAPSNFSLALITGWIYQDDEDKNNEDWYIDAGLTPPLSLKASPIPTLIVGDSDTKTFLARVR